MLKLQIFISTKNNCNFQIMQAHIYDWNEKDYVASNMK